MMPIIARPDAERAINRADAGAHDRADSCANRTSRAVPSVGTLFGAANQTLRLGDDRKSQRGAKTSGKNEMQFHRTSLKNMP